MSAVARAVRRLWSGLRAVLGDDAYEHYLRHCRLRHPDAPTLDRRAFYASELDRRWRQINRCC
jgi:uncharacterized short protein YbdD (DUF466 family)